MKQPRVEDPYSIETATCRIETAQPRARVIFVKHTKTFVRSDIIGRVDIVYGVRSSGSVDATIYYWRDYWVEIIHFREGDLNFTVDSYDPKEEDIWKDVEKCIDWFDSFSELGALD